MNTRIAYKARPKDVEGTKQAKRRRLAAQDSAHKTGPGKRNIVLEHVRLEAAAIRTIKRINQGRHPW